MLRELEKNMKHEPKNFQVFSELGQYPKVFGSGHPNTELIRYLLYQVTL